MSRHLIAKLAQATISFAVSLGLIVQPLAAQQIVDPSAPLSKQPQIGKSGTGVPQINITTPEAGVSHNKFKSYDVGTQGVILNNSTAAGTSRIGGAVGANPNLATSGPANVIVQEVTGTATSTLSGATEVFGKRADVILANPNGITCNGCSFLNTGRATLATGVPIIANGNVSLTVTKGALRIGGAGVSAPDGDAALVGRHVFIDGKTSAFGDLFVSGGAQYFDNATGQSRAAPAITARETPFAVDATQLGAMNAGQIRILGNEAGLGVRTYGTQTAKKAGQAAGATGNVSIAGSGDVSYFDIAADGKGAISGAGAVTQYGNASFGQSVAIATGSFNLIHGRTLSSKEDIAISAEGQVVIEGEVTGRNIKITAAKGLTNVGFIMADGATEIISGDALDNYRRKLQGYVISYAPELEKYLPTIQAYRTMGGAYAAQAEAWVKQWELRTLVEEYAARGGTISGAIVNGSITGAIRNTGGLITATDGLTLSSGSSILNTYIKLLTITDGDITGGKHYEFHEGEILSGGAMKIAAKTDIINEASTIAAYGDLTLDAGGAVKNWVTADKYILTQTANLGASGSYSAINQTTRDEKMAIAPGLLASLVGDVTIRAGSFSSVGSDISAGGDIKLITSGDAKLLQVVELLTDTVATSYTGTERYCQYSGYIAIRACNYYGLWSYRTATTTTTTSTSEAIVIASNLIGRDITIDAASLDAPAVKIAAERDLTIRTKQPLVFKPGFDLNRNTALIADATDYTGGWETSFAGDANADFTLEDFYSAPVAAAAILDDQAAGDAITQSALTASLKAASVKTDYDGFMANQGALRSLATLNAIGRANPGQGGAAIKDAARRVGAQAWAAAVSKTGFAHVDQASIREGEESFSAALLKTASAVAITNPAIMAAMSWRFATDDGLAAVAVSPAVVLHAGRDLLLASTDSSLSFEGEIYAARDLAFQAKTDVALSGSISEGRDLYVTSASGGFTNATTLTSTRDLVIDAYGTVRNTGKIASGQSLAITSRAGAIENIATRTGNTLAPATLAAGTGGLVLAAATDIVNQGSTIRSAGAMLLRAARDVKNEAFADKYTTVDSYAAARSCTWYGKCTYYEGRSYDEASIVRPAELIAGTDLTLIVGRDLTNIGGVITAGRTLDATVGRDITVSAAAVELRRISYASSSSSWFGFIPGGKGYDSYAANRYDIARGTLSGGNVTLRGGGDFIASGATISSQSGLSLVMDGQIGILPVQYQTYVNIASGKKGLFSKSSTAATTQKTNTTVSSLDTSKDLSIVSKTNDVVIQAGQLTSGGDMTIVAEKGRILFLTAKGVEYQQINKDSTNLVWWKKQDSGYYLESIIASHIMAGGKLTVKAANGVVIEYDESKASASDAIRQLSKSPELAWMLEMQTRNDVQWRAVQGVYDQWDHKAEGLTQGASAVIALAVTIATQGAASGFAAGLVATAGAAGATASVMSSALTAGFQAIVSKAAVSLANNKGNLGKVLKELGSNASIKSIATSMVTAGLIAAMPVNVVPVAAADPVTGVVQKLTFAQQLQVNIVKAAVSTSVSTAINGGNFGDQLKDSMILAAVQSVGAEAATQIGIAAKTGQIDKATQLIAHAALGCGMGAATGGSKGCAGGAIGGVVGEVVSKIYIASQRGEYVTITTKELVSLKEAGINFGKLAGALVALGTSTDVNSAVATADNAARNNALDTIWDVISVLYDGGKIAYGYYKNDNGLIEEGFVDLTADTAAMLIVFVPAGTTKAARMVANSADDIGDVVVRTVKEGEFSILDWTKYPDGLPKPEGTFRILSGSEYDSARKAANEANAKLRKEWQVPSGYEIHEIKPIKFGGSATDPANKIVISASDHRSAVTPWWNAFERAIKTK